MHWSPGYWRSMHWREFMAYVLVVTEELDEDEKPARRRARAAGIRPGQPPSQRILRSLPTLSEEARLG